MLRNAPRVKFVNTWGSAHPADAQFLFTDGAVLLLPYGASPSILAALLTPHGGEVVTPP